MTDEPSSDPDERPGAVARLFRRLNHVRSLPGPDPSHFPLALGFPSPTILEEGPTTVPSAEIHATLRRVYVTVEIPGVPKDAIDIQAWEDRVTVHAPRPGGPTYCLELALPERVDSRSARSTYRNGVLDITFLRSPRPDNPDGEPDDR